MTGCNTLCPECLWPLVRDEDGFYCERCDGEDDPVTAMEKGQEDAEEIENTPCKVCGSTETPLHFNRVCGNCYWDDSIDEPTTQGRLGIREHALRQTQFVLGAWRDGETPENFSFEEFKYVVIDPACGNDDVNTPGTYDHDYCGIMSKHMNRHPETYPTDHPLRHRPVIQNDRTRKTT